MEKISKGICEGRRRFGSPQAAADRYLWGESARVCLEIGGFSTEVGFRDGGVLQVGVFLWEILESHRSAMRVD